MEGAWEWSDLQPEWQEAIFWLGGSAKPTGAWDWMALEEDWMEKAIYTLRWKRYWKERYSNTLGWPLGWN